MVCGTRMALAVGDTGGVGSVRAAGVRTVCWNNHSRQELGQQMPPATSAFRLCSVRSGPSTVS